MPYHVRITTKSAPYDEVGLDLTEEELQERILQPYRDGNSIVIGGRTISADDFARIRINYTDESSEQLLPLVKAERRKNTIYSGPPGASEVAKRGRDVTDQSSRVQRGPPLAPKPRRVSERPSIQERCSLCTGGTPKFATRSSAS